MRNFLVITLLISIFGCGDDTTDPQNALPDAGSSADLGTIGDAEYQADTGTDDGGAPNASTDAGEPDAGVDMAPMPIPNDLCVGADTIEPGVVTGSTEGSRFGPEPAGLWQDSGQARWFRYTFDSDAQAELRATGLDFNIWLGAMGSCPTNNGVDGTFMNSRDGMLMWDGVAGESVIIVVTGEDREEGQFELELTLSGQ